jgi:hypothetical protein
LRKENLLRTARKWLTGLLPTAVPTAFGDLDPANLDRPGTVLGSLADLPIERTPHAAIVGADTRVDDLAVSERNLVGRFILRHAVPARWFAAVQDPYATIALDELSAGQPLSPRQSAVARRYREGLRVAAPTQDADLAPFAHDFVIPSASQALHVLAPPPPEVFLGNAINARATHVSGAEERGCDSDAPAVRRMLRAIGRLLP